LVALSTVLMAAVVASMNLLGSFIAYLLRPMTRYSARPSQGSDPARCGEAKKV
jgi:hypothetical protein